jgi:thymidylate synthase (FAD)
MKVDYIHHFGDDLMVANTARVSMDKRHDEFEWGKDDRLIEYLASHEHVTPFFHPQIQLRITAPIFVARQWYRSVIGVARNEVSRRYVDTPPEFFVPTTWRSRPPGSLKQGSGDAMEPHEQRIATEQLQHAHALAEGTYHRLLDLGVAPEQARMVLPQSMLTTWIETGSLAYWARVYRLRADHHAQGEIQDLATLVAHVVEPLFPVSWRALTQQR